MDKWLKWVVLTVALLNLGYFGIEFAIASAIGSVSLFADSVDFLEDASVNLLILGAGLERRVPRQGGDGTGGSSARSRHRYVVDCMGKVQRAGRSGAVASLTCGDRRARDQSLLRAHAGGFSTASWKPHAGSVLIGPQ